MARATHCWQVVLDDQEHLIALEHLQKARERGLVKNGASLLRELVLGRVAIDSKGRVVRVGELVNGVPTNFE